MARSSSRPARAKRPGNHRGLKVFLVALVVLLVLLVLNAFALNNETKPASLNVPGATLVSTTSGDLQVLDTGPAPNADPNKPDPLPIVLVHGSASAINWWNELIPLLSPTHRVIAVDMLGYGGSNKPDSGYSMENQANIITQALAKLDVAQAVLVGHSLGGEVVTAMAEQSPGLVAGVTIIDDAPDLSYGGLGGTAALARAPILGQAIWRLSPRFMLKKSLSQAFAPGYDVPTEFVDDIKDMTYTAYKKSYEEGDSYTKEEPLDQRLQALDKPLLIMFGEEDQIFNARESISAYAAIPGVKTVLIPGSGHSPQVEKPKEAAAAILDFTNALDKELLPPPVIPKKDKKNGKNQNGKSGKSNKNGSNNQSGNGKNGNAAKNTNQTSDSGNKSGVGPTSQASRKSAQNEPKHQAKNQTDTAGKSN